MPAVFLKNRSLIRVSGPEAQSFLQNLITTDLAALAADEARPGALLTPQGKILFDFMIWQDGDGFIIDTDDDQRDALLKRLGMYKLRAAVDLSPAGEGVTVSWDGANTGPADSRFAKAGVALVRPPGGEDSTWVSRGWFASRTAPLATGARPPGEEEVEAGRVICVSVCVD